MYVCVFKFSIIHKVYKYTYTYKVLLYNLYHNNTCICDSIVHGALNITMADNSVFRANGKIAMGPMKKINESANCTISVSRRT